MSSRFRASETVLKIFCRKLLSSLCVAVLCSLTCMFLTLCLRLFGSGMLRTQLCSICLSFLCAACGAIFCQCLAGGTLKGCGDVQRLKTDQNENYYYQNCCYNAQFWPFVVPNYEHLIVPAPFTRRIEFARFSLFRLYHLRRPLKIFLP